MHSRHFFVSWQCSCHRHHLTQPAGLASLHRRYRQHGNAADTAMWSVGSTLNEVILWPM